MSVIPKKLITYQKSYLKLIQKIYFQISKSLKNLKTKNVFPKSCLFVSLPYDFLKFQKQLMTKSETRLDFKPLGNHQYIKGKINSNEQKSQKTTITRSYSRRHFENDYWKLLGKILVEINKNILDLVFIIFCLNRNEQLLVIVAYCHIVFPNQHIEISERKKSCTTSLLYLHDTSKAKKALHFLSLKLVLKIVRLFQICMQNLLIAISITCLLIQTTESGLSVSAQQQVVLIQLI